MIVLGPKEENMDETPLQKFSRLASKASYHYADDTGSEWLHGDNAKAAALAVFDAHPELHSQMREAMKTQLWQLSNYR